MYELYLVVAVILMVAGGWLHRAGGSRMSQAIGLAALLAGVGCLVDWLFGRYVVWLPGNYVPRVVQWICLASVPVAVWMAWWWQWPRRRKIRWCMLAALAASGLTLLWPYWLGLLALPFISVYTSEETEPLIVFLPAMLLATLGLSGFLFAFYAAAPICLGLMLVHNARWPGLRYAGIALLVFGGLLWLGGVMPDVVLWTEF